MSYIQSADTEIQLTKKHEEENLRQKMRKTKIRKQIRPGQSRAPCRPASEKSLTLMRLEHLSWAQKPSQKFLILLPGSESFYRWGGKASSSAQSEATDLKYSKWQICANAIIILLKWHQNGEML